MCTCTTKRGYAPLSATLLQGTTTGSIPDELLYTREKKLRIGGMKRKGRNMNSMAEASMLIIALFLLMFTHSISAKDRSIKEIKKYDFCAVHGNLRQMRNKLRYRTCYFTSFFLCSCFSPSMLPLLLCFAESFPRSSQ